MSSDRINERNDFPEYLLAKNQEANPINIALFSAALNNDTAAVRSSIAQGAKVDFFCRPEDNKNALHISAEKGYISVAEELLKSGAQVNAVAVSSQDTPLILACQNGHAHIVKLLLNNGADVNRGLLLYHK